MEIYNPLEICNPRFMELVPNLPKPNPTGIPGAHLHIPGRPHWACKKCGQPYPCETARAELLAGYGDMKVSLSIHLAGLWIDCLTDFYTIHPFPPNEAPSVHELYDRFFTWAHLGRPYCGPPPGPRPVEEPADPDRPRIERF